MSAYSNLYKLVYSKVSNPLAVESYSIPVYPQNFVPQAREDYLVSTAGETPVHAMIRLEVLPTGSDPVTYSKPAHSGLIICQIYVSEHLGTSLILKIADALDDMLTKNASGQGLSVEFSSLSFQGIDSQEQLYRADWSTPFRYIQN